MGLIDFLEDVTHYEPCFRCQYALRLKKDPHVVSLRFAPLDISWNPIMPRSCYELTRRILILIVKVCDDCPYPIFDQEVDPIRLSAPEMVEDHLISDRFFDLPPLPCNEGIGSIGMPYSGEELPKELHLPGIISIRCTSFHGIHRLRSDSPGYGRVRAHLYFEDSPFQNVKR